MWLILLYLCQVARFLGVFEAYCSRSVLKLSDCTPRMKPFSKVTRPVRPERTLLSASWLLRSLELPGWSKLSETRLGLMTPEGRFSKRGAFVSKIMVPEGSF